MKTLLDVLAVFILLAAFSKVLYWVMDIAVEIELRRMMKEREDLWNEQDTDDKESQ